MASELVGAGGFVGDEGMDFGEVDYLEACLLGDPDEDVMSDDGLFDFLSASVLPDMHVPLGCCEGFDALL